MYRGYSSVTAEMLSPKNLDETAERAVDSHTENAYVDGKPLGLLAAIRIAEFRL